MVHGKRVGSQIAFDSHKNTWEGNRMDLNRKNLVVAGMAALLTFGGLAGCGDGVDQDNGLSDGKQKDQIDQETKVEAKGSLNEAKENIKEAMKDVEKELNEKSKEQQ
jgi:hypothetical protein